MNIEFCSKALLYTADAKLNEMWPQVYFILGLVFPPKLFIIAEKHMSALFYSTFWEKGELGQLLVNNCFSTLNRDTLRYIFWMFL